METTKLISLRINIEEDTNFDLKSDAARNRMNKTDFIKKLLEDYTTGKLTYND
tara:strand:+ start:1115 stop:1273 length:159 start_codon:yes stop_codon:yes gene_type:complete